jgi:hypothetical protein
LIIIEIINYLLIYLLKVDVDAAIEVVVDSVSFRHLF